MKKKNEEEKNELFFYKTEIVSFQYKETSNLADFKYVIRIFTSALVGKLQRVKVEAHNANFGRFYPFFPTLVSHNF